jgi:hypothetical protein
MFVDSCPAGFNVSSLAISKNDEIFIGMQNDSVYRYTKNLTNWVSFSSGVSRHDYDPNSDWDFTITCLALSKAGDIWAGTSENGLYRSSDNGKSWTIIDPVDREIRAIDIGTNGEIFAGSHEDGLFLSEDDGKSWTEINSGYNAEWGCYNFATYKNIVFAENVTGIYMSTNNGLNWRSVSEGLPTEGINDSYWINSIAVSGGYVFVVIDSSVWRRPVSEITGVIFNKKQSRMSQQIMFNVCTKSSYVIVRFSLPHSLQVYVDLYNLSGIKKVSIVDSYLITGSHSYSLDTRNIPAGWYTVRMHAGSDCKVKSIPILR